MKASSDNHNIELTGKVVFKKFAAGSKSEHEAAYIETSEDSYVLRRLGGNPFKDASLEKLKNKMVTVTGFIKNYIFFFRSIKPHEK